MSKRQLKMVPSPAGGVDVIDDYGNILFTGTERGAKNFLSSKPKRQKTVFTSAEIAHVWRNEGAPYGRCPASMSFDGDAFSSYSTVIARRIRYNGKVAYVRDVATFSSTTSSHQGAVRSALADTDKVFRVSIGWRKSDYFPPNNYTFGGREVRVKNALNKAAYDLSFTPALLRDYYLAEYRKTEEAAKSRYAHIRAGEVLRKQGELEKALDVCQYFGLKSSRIRSMIHKRATETVEAELIVETHNEKLRVRRAERDEKARARRAQREAAEIATAIKRAEEIRDGKGEPLGQDENFGHGWIADSNAYGVNDNLLESRPDLQKVIAEKRIEAQQNLIERWRNGEQTWKLPVGIPTMLRAIRPRVFNDIDAQWEIETSQGARIPYDEGKRAFQFIMARRGRDWRPNGERFKIGMYALDAINGVGIIAGCHRFTWEEIDRFATAEGWTYRGSEEIRKRAGGDFYATGERALVEAEQSDANEDLAE